MNISIPELKEITDRLDRIDRRLERLEASWELPQWCDLRTLAS